MGEKGSKFCPHCGGVFSLCKIDASRMIPGIGYVDLYKCCDCHLIAEFHNPNRKRVNPVAKESGDGW